MQRPTKDGIKANSEGMLHKDLFVIQTTPTNGLEAVMDQLEGHLAFQVGLETDGIMFAAGPLWADDGETWDGEGIVIIRAADLSEARQIAERDPMHSSGAREFTVRPWMLNEGSISIEMKFSTGRYSVV